MFLVWPLSQHAYTLCSQQTAAVLHLLYINCIYVFWIMLNVNIASAPFFLCFAFLKLRVEAINRKQWTIKLLFNWQHVTTHQRWNVTKYFYSSNVLHFEEPVLYHSNSIFSYHILSCVWSVQLLVMSGLDQQHIFKLFSGIWFKNIKKKKKKKKKTAIYKLEGLEIQIQRQQSPCIQTLFSWEPWFQICDQVYPSSTILQIWHWSLCSHEAFQVFIVCVSVCFFMSWKRSSEPLWRKVQHCHFLSINAVCATKKKQWSQIIES